MGTQKLEGYRRIRFLVGGGLGLFAMIILLPWSPLLAFIALLGALISSVRAFLNGSLVKGLLLIKVTAVCIPLFPFLVGAGVKLREEGAAPIYWLINKPDSTAEITEPVITQNQPTPIDPPEPSKEVTLSIPAPAPASVEEGLHSPPKQTEPRKAQTASLSTPEEFVKFYRLAEQKDDLDLVMKQYADSVSYFNKTRSKGEIREDKEGYWKKWPVRTETLHDTFKVSQDMHPEWERPIFVVKFTSSFRNENPQTKRWFEADLENFYILIKENGKFQVVTQDVTVLATRKGGGSKQKIEMLPKGAEISDSARQAVALIEKLAKAEESRDIGQVVGLYAESINYFGKDLHHDAVLEDKLSYFQKWPRLTAERLSPYRVEVIARRNFLITYKSKFRVTSQDGFTWREGVVDNEFVVTMRTSPMKITQQSGKVSKLRKHPAKK